MDESDLTESKVSSLIDPRRWLQVAFGVTKEPAVETVRSELGASIMDSVYEALKKIHYYQDVFQKKNLRNGVQKSLPAYSERNSAKAAKWIYEQVLEKRPYLKTALLDNYASYWGSLLEDTAALMCSQICSGQTVSNLFISNCSTFL
jgi:hypothetical protein